MHSAFPRAELAVHDVVEHGFEVVEEDRVRSAFEDESEAPIGVYPATSCHAGGGDGGVGKEKGYGKELLLVSNGVGLEKMTCIPCTAT